MKKFHFLCLLLMVSLFSSSITFGETTEGTKKDKKFPSKYDLRDLDRTTPVKTQGAIGSCWAVSFLDSMESNLKTLKDEELIFSVNNMITSSSNLYFQNYNRNAANGGDQAIATAYVASWNGPVLETQDPYAVKGKRENINLVTGLAPVKHVQEVIFVPERKDAQDNNIIKEMVMKYGGISASMWKGTPSTYGKFYNHDKFAWFYPYDYMNKEGNGHAVTIIGWDDNFSKDNFAIKPKGDGAFIVKNTKGPEWGQPGRKENMGGYFYISYYDMMFGAVWDANVGMSVVTRIDDIDNYNHIYQHDPLGYTKKYTPSTDDNSVFFTNVFEIEDRETVREQLSAVSFYTLDSDLDYEIYIQGNFESPKSLKKMKLVKKGSIELPGYHTIDLDKSVFLYPNKKVAVGVKLISKDKTPSIALESPEGFITSSAVSNLGESYIKNSENKFDDVAELFPNSNACLKIFTSETKAYNVTLLTPELMKKDFDYVINRLKTYQPTVRNEGFTEEQEAIIKECYDSISEPLTEQEYYLVVKRLFTMNNDAHVNIHRYFHDKYLDLSFVWIEDGIIVNKTTGNFLLGDKILSFGGKSPSELYGLLKKQISSENNYHLRYKSPWYLTSRYYAEYFDLLNHDETMDIVIERDGKKIVLEESFTSSYRNIHIQNSIKDIFSWHIEKENNLAYFRLDSWISSGDSRFSELKENIDQFFKEVVDNKIDNFILDIRQNPGGSMPACNYMLKYMDSPKLYRDGLYRPHENLTKVSDELLFKGKTYIMTSYRSFSCSLFVSTLFRGNGLAAIIGEPTGEKPNFNIHGSKADGNLPSTNWSFMMTTYRPKSITGFSNDETTLTPDIQINRRASDIVANRDIQLEKMREITRTSSNCLYSSDSINIFKGETLTLKKDSNQHLITFDSKNMNLTVPFDSAAIKDVYLQNTVTLEKEICELKDNTVVLPESLSSKTVYLAFELKNTSKKYKILLNNLEKESAKFKNTSSIHPKIDDVKFSVHNKFKYLLLRFDRLLEKQHIIHDVSFTHNGKKLELTHSPLARNFKNILLLCYENQLPEDDGYSITIPKGTIKFANGNTYPKQLKFDFKINKTIGSFRVDTRSEGYKVILASNQDIISHKLRDAVLIDPEDGHKIVVTALGSYRSYYTLYFSEKLDPAKEYTLKIPKESVEFKFSGFNKEVLEYKVNTK